MLVDPQSSVAEALGSLPGQPARLLGRDEAIRHLQELLTERPIVSIVGPGGIGKTSLAVAIARLLAPSLPDGVHFVDLSKQGSPGSALRELAMALGITRPVGDLLALLVEKLRRKRTLILLDSCEAAIEDAALLAEAAASSGTQVLATSREPLAAADEWVHRIEPLPCPPQGTALPAWLAATYPALHLFAKMAWPGGSGGSASLLANSGDVELASGICRRLDGNPLAIKLAASRVGSLGLAGVAEQIDRKMLDWQSEAEPASRHQSLEAVLDWSFQLLGREEQAVFLALATFRSHFSFEAAVMVGGEASQKDQVAAVILDLVAKSLLVPQQWDGDGAFRLLDTTRSYAERALERAGPQTVAACRRRHAGFLVQMLAGAQQQWDTMEQGVWRQKNGAWVEDVRAALAWSCSDAGERVIGVALTIAALPLAEQTGLMSDYGHFARFALTEVSAMRPPRPDLELRLNTSPVLGLHTKAQTNEAHDLAALSRALEQGRAEGTAQAQLGVLLALWAHAFQAGDYQAAALRATLIDKLADLHRDAVARVTAQRTRAQTLHFLGDHRGAKVLALRICANPPRRVPLAYLPSPVSMEVSMRIVLARIHWIEGCADQAWTVVHDCLRMAQEDHPMSICQTLAVAAVPLAFWCGRPSECRAWLEQLSEQAQRYGYDYWANWARRSTALLDATEPALSGTLLEIQAPGQVKMRDHAATFLPTALTQESCERVVRREVGWCAPEVLRLEAEVAMAEGSGQGFSRAQLLLDRSVDLARDQGALAWELRAAMSGVRLAQAMGEGAGAIGRLAALRARFVEGAATADLVEADRLLGHGEAGPERLT